MPEQTSSRTLLAYTRRQNNCSRHLNRWNQRAHSTVTPESEARDVALNVNGFGSISRRHSSCKPIIAAVNGGSYGGGTEMVLNCDIVIASDQAVFATPEVKRGVVAIMGGLPSIPCAFLRAHSNGQVAQSYQDLRGSLVISWPRRCCSWADP